jgi:hypothetical protein
VVSPLPQPASTIAPNRAKINVACFKRRTPDEIDSKEAGKPDYNIADTAARRAAYGKVPEKLLNTALE